MIGSKIGRYEIIGRIGLGGGGEVFLAHDTSLDRQVALKFLFTESAGDLKARRRFLAEARAAAAIDHPFVCKIYEVGEDEGRLFIAMEYVQGRTLKSALAEGDLPARKRIQITVEIAEALATAHAKGIVHRDLKPSNIMLTPDGHVKVMDFGLAKRLQRGDIDAARPPSRVASGEDQTLTLPGLIVGTPPYMSPEQAECLQIDARSDIFSLGIILYEMCAGFNPFQKNAPIATMLSIINDIPEPVSHHWPECPLHVQRVVDRMLVKDVDQRFQSIEEVCDSLSGITEVMAAVTTTPALPSVHSIAVLPFLNMSRREENDYFTDGITEEIILQVSKIRGVKVISLTSVMHFKSTDLDLQAIGRKLAVDTIIQGSVRWAGNRVRIAGKLFDIATNSQIWADAFNRELEDVFGIQEEVAAKIAASLERSLCGAGPQEQSEATGPQSFAAYQDYLRGRYFLHKTTLEENQKAIAFFQKAIDQDPAYAKAYAGLAACYAQGGHVGFLPITDAFPKARAAALRALSLDNTLPEAHASIALTRLFLDWDLEGADEAFRRAIELNPNYAEARWLYSWHAAARGRLDEAVAEARRAVELDPLSPLATLNLGWVLAYAERTEAAIEAVNKTLELAPDLVSARIMLASIYLLQERFDEAIAICQTCALPPPQLAQAYAMAGQRDTARELLETLAEEQKHDSAFWVGLDYLLLGELDEGFAWLHRANQYRDAKLLYLEHLPPMKHLRSNPRFVRFFEEIGLRPCA